jgi:uncharacterized membrane protein YcfT
MRERLGWLDAARGIALALVVLLHVVAWLRSVDFTVSAWLIRADDILDGFRMPTLVLISGLLASSVGAWTWRAVLRRRVGPLVLLYVVWTPIVVLVVDWVRDAEVVLADSGLEWMLLRPEQRMWYFYALAVYIAAARLLRRAPSAPLLVAAVLINLAAMQWLADSLLPHNVQWWSYVLQHWVFFVAAERLASSYRALAERRSRAVGGAALSVFVVFGAVTIALGIAESPVPLLILGVLGSLVTLTFIPLVGDARVLGWARAVGRRSLGIYAMHAALAALVVTLVAQWLPRFEGAGLLIPLVVAAAVVALAFGATRVLEQWAPVPFLRPWWSTTADEPKTVLAPAQ